MRPPPSGDASMTDFFWAMGINAIMLMNKTDMFTSPWYIYCRESPGA